MQHRNVLPGGQAATTVPKGHLKMQKVICLNQEAIIRGMPVGGVLLFMAQGLDVYASELLMDPYWCPVLMHVETVLQC